MKKFLFLMTMVCTLGFFASCSSDDNNTTSGGETSSSVWDTLKPGEVNLWGEHLDIDSDDNLLTYGLVDLKLSVEKAGDNTAKLTLLYQGKSDTLSVSVPEAAIVAVDGYTLKGAGTMTVSSVDHSTSKYSKTTKDATVTVKITGDYNSVSAELTADGKTLSLTNASKPEYAELMGTWHTYATTYYNENGEEVDADDAAGIPQGCFKFTWTTNEGTNINWGGYPMPTASVAALAERVANQQDISNVLSSVAFTRDGKIIARYRSSESKGDDTKWQIAEDYATYTTMGSNQIMVKLNTEKILSTVTDEQEKAVLTQLFGIFEAGIPVHYKLDDDGSMLFYLDKYFALGLAEDDTIKGLVAQIKDTDLDGMGALIKSFCSQVPDLLKNTTELQVGLNLVK